jgi:hypothetical protein
VTYFHEAACGLAGDLKRHRHRAIDDLSSHTYRFCEANKKAATRVSIGVHSRRNPQIAATINNRCRPSQSIREILGRSQFAIRIIFSRSYIRTANRVIAQTVVV